MWAFFSRDASKDFPYDVGEPICQASEESIWSIHKGKKRGTAEEVTVFVFDRRNCSENKLEIARATVKRLKTLRHPSILMYLDSYESDRVLYLATEYVEPLCNHLQNISKNSRESELYLSWGIFQITRALSFLNNDGNLRHNNVCCLTVFVNMAGEWKLGGVEHMAGLTEGQGLAIKILPFYEKYGPPEKSDPLKQRHITKCSTDMWGLGCLVWEVFNGPLPQLPSLRNTSKIPKSLVGIYSELILPNPNCRPNPADVITRCRKNDGFFKNDLVDTLLFLEEIQIKDKNEKNRFFNSLSSLLDHFPSNVCKYKILPHLINAFEYGDAGAAVLTPLLKLGKLLEDTEYQKKIVPCVVKLFTCNDRATRSKLLQQLENYIGNLQSSTINDQIFPQIVNGFLDTNPMIREQTIKSMIHLSPKLSYTNLNVEILRHFARLQSKDDQGGIRTNTTVCLGKIAQYLHPDIRQKVLISAFIRAMRDPFPPARTAGILALAATQQYFLLSEVAARVLPALCQLTVDPDKSVRDHVFRTIKGFLGKLEKLSEDPSLRQSMECDVHASTPNLSNAAATWAGWAVTAVTSKFYRSQSDITKSTTPHLTKNFHKPASLEIPPSSSSISTTTTSSEVTSLASFEQEDRAMDSLSDYDESWETENWGDIQADENNQAQMLSNSQNSSFEAKTDTIDGWDIDDWNGADSTTEINHNHPNSPVWGNVEWNANEESDTNKEQDEVRKTREEKRIHRQKELQMKKNQRQNTKLGAKKL